VTKIKNIWAKIVKRSLNKRRAFTLPEVIVAFSVLVMVITTATQVLVTVIRVNATNVNSLVAYGLAQEGLEAVRFVRDSDTVLGLQFDGATKVKPSESIWGQKLFEDSATEGVKFFALQLRSVEDLKPGCKKAADFDNQCLPIQLTNLDGSDPEALKTSDATLVYKKISAADTVNKGLIYFQNDTASTDTTLSPTQFHRFIRVEALKNGLSVVKTLRISSVVAWTGENGEPMQVVLTSELTNWK